MYTSNGYAAPTPGRGGTNAAHGIGTDTIEAFWVPGKDLPLEEAERISLHPYDWSPAWSPDGETIVFASERSGQLALWAMSPDGSDVRRLTDGVDEYPTWSPDSRQIGFGRGLPLSDIWVVDRDGSHERQLTSDPDPEWLPAWSPDGREIAYTRGFEGHGTIWVMAADGSDQRQLTRGHDDMAPDWSGDGEWLVFSRRGTLYTMRKDGEHVQSLDVAGFLADWARSPE